MVRDPRGGRTFESYGEDPRLLSDMSVAWIRALQRAGLIADVKHFAANKQETSRFTVNEIIDERTLREIYLPHFEAAVRRGHVGTVMTAYNKVNGAYAGGNEHLLQDVLKGDWGCPGWVMSDWGATPEWEFALAGLDQVIDRIGRGGELAPRVPLPGRLERRRGRVEGEHLRDSLAQRRERGRHQRDLGAGRSAPVSAISAWPIGLPSRV